MIANIANIQVPFRPELDAVRSVEPCLGSLSTVSRESGFSHAGYGPNAVGFGVHPPDDMVFHLHKEEVPRYIKPDFVGFVEFGFRGGASIAHVAFGPGADDCGDDPGFPIHLPDGVVHGITNIQGSSWPLGDPKGPIYFCHCCRAFIAIKALFSRTNKGGDRCRMNASGK